MATNLGAITWDYLITYEPDLLVLEHDVQRVVGPDYALEGWFARILKPRMTELVGWGRRVRTPGPAAVEECLRSQRAYVVALRHLYDLLPLSRP